MRGVLNLLCREAKAYLIALARHVEDAGGWRRLTPSAHPSRQIGELYTRVLQLAEQARADLAAGRRGDADASLESATRWANEARRLIADAHMVVVITRPRRARARAGTRR